MSKPFHVYLDLNVFNNDLTPSSKAPQLSFEETRTQPFLEGTADDYFVAIARFTVQTGGALPVFIPAIDTTQSNPNMTVYKITLTYRDQVGSANVVYAPQPNANKVVPPLGGQDFWGNYYYVYNYQDWITMVNTALGKAHTQLFNKVKTAYPKDGFAGTDPSYTETITMANKDGAPATSVTISSTTAPSYSLGTVSYTHLTLPTNREV